MWNALFTEEKRMTNYQKLIDTINQELFKYWQSGSTQQLWNEEEASRTSHKILTYVETYKAYQVNSNLHHKG